MNLPKVEKLLSFIMRGRGVVDDDVVDTHSRKGPYF